ncbi:MAG: heme lyase CcmF/NrfE family subunit [Gammaproteobacteria bacterium]
MIPEIGHFALILALSVAVVQGVFPLWGSLTAKPQWIALARPAAYGQLLFMVVSFCCLLYAFVTNDFSVKYVASNSNTEMPTIFRVSALWGAHEGSLLLWAMILAAWGAAVALFSKGIPPIMLARVLSIMGLIGVGFALFLIVTSNPFERLLNIPLEGRQLNPLLQDFGLAVHPPMLYMGYVGMSVAFSFAMAAMIGGKLDAAWARWARPWTNVAWMFLTWGIALGSWWAYYELGWGGWWFWDPVENASLMPWIVGTALIHSLAVTEKRASFKTWTILLSILAFSLSLLGTFLVRSGVLTSVHSFASDPERGLFILIFLGVVIGSSLLLFAFRAHKMRSIGSFSLISRESGLLVNNVILLVMTATVLLGTIYPLIIDAFGAGKISVGPPYFNSIIVPLAMVLFTVMGFGFYLRWKKDSFSRVLKKVWIPLAASLVMAFILPLILVSEFNIKTVLGLFAGSWISLSALMWVISLGRSPFKLPLASWGSVIAHLGMAMTVTGVTVVSLYDTEKDVRLEAGQSYEMAGYTFTFQGIETHTLDNYSASRATMEIKQAGEYLTTVYPEKRDYGPGAMPMTEAGIDAGFLRDLFVALGEPLGGNAWSFRIYHKPFVRWLWLGGMFMGIGGLLASLDKRYRRMRKVVVDNSPTSTGTLATGSASA